MTLTLKQRFKSDLTSEEALARSMIVPGVKLYGYCLGMFGRDSYDDKLVTKVEGNVIHAIENGDEVISFEISSWVELVRSSNKALDNERYEAEIP